QITLQYLRELRAAAERYRESGLPILACGDSARRHELSIFRPNHRSPSYFFGDLSSTQSCCRGLSEIEKGFLSIEHYPLPQGEGAKREPDRAKPQERVRVSRFEKTSFKASLYRACAPRASRSAATASRESGHPASAKRRTSVLYCRPR